MALSESASSRYLNIIRPSFDTVFSWIVSIGAIHEPIGAAPTKALMISSRNIG
jgi:hypothetical protein